MNPQIAANALKFISRADMKGHEADAYMEVRKALIDICNAPVQAPTAGEANSPE